MPLESLTSSRRYATLYVIDAGANGKPLYDFLLVPLLGYLLKTFCCYSSKTEGAREGVTIND